MPTAAVLGIPQQGFQTQPYRENLHTTRDHSEGKYYTRTFKITFMKTVPLKNFCFITEPKHEAECGSSCVCHLQPDGASEVPMSRGSCSPGTFHLGPCGPHGGCWAGGSRQQGAGIQRRAEGQAGKQAAGRAEPDSRLSPSTDTLLPARLRPRGGQPRTEQNRDNGMAGERNALHFS